MDQRQIFKRLFGTEPERIRDDGPLTDEEAGDVLWAVEESPFLQHLVDGEVTPKDEKG